MKLHFFGAARAVTGSCHMIETGDMHILVDCGLRQGADAQSEYGESDFPFDPTKIDYVLLTHAHIDHSGMLPLLYKRGFKGQIITTSATASLASIMLPDSAHVQQQEAEWKNRKRERAGKAAIEPLYTIQDALESIKLFRPVEYKQEIALGDSVRARFMDAGHLLGSSCVELWVVEHGKSTKLVFSGDIGHADRPIVRDPDPITEADYVIMEATYGDRLHEFFGDQDAKVRELAGIIESTFKRGGNLVIPSFAVGRTQEILYYINLIIKKNILPNIKEIPVYVDSPLGIEATNIYEHCAKGYYDEEALELAKLGSPFKFDSLHIAKSVEESKLINEDPTSKVIISSSGMCEVGRIKHHLKHNLWRGESTILFVGYQAIGTLGRNILDGAKKVRLFGEDITVNAHIEQIEGFSGHADQKELLEWLFKFNPKPKKVFLVHGETTVIEKFAQVVRDNGYDVSIPSMFETVDLEAGRVTVSEVMRAKGEKAPKLKAPLPAETHDRDEIMASLKRIGLLLDVVEQESADAQLDLKLQIMNKDMEAFAEKWEKLLLDK
jgi:metallo-beta-lactamase family protein